NLWLIGAFSVTAFALAALGVYGLIAYTVSQRVREIGIRMVLGAEKGGVIAMIVAGGLKLAAVGVALGLVLSLGLKRLLDGLLFGVTSSDPAVFAAVVGATLGAVLFASYLPARRVVMIPPTESLKDA
ncbi:MAG: FtsX-like permease family protein, partial [Vicinamibacteria bacterium]